MKKLLMAIMCVAGLFLSGCSKSDELQNDKIYFFYQQTCPHCHSAADYIKKNYPTLQMVNCDIQLPGNMRLFQQAARKYEIKSGVGTPLFTFGDNFIMGWSEDNARLFDKYVIPYLKK